MEIEHFSIQGQYVASDVLQATCDQTYCIEIEHLSIQGQYVASDILQVTCYQIYCIEIETIHNLIHYWPVKQ